MIAAGTVFTVKGEVSSVFDDGSRWRIVSVEPTVFVLHRIGKRGQRLTSKWTTNEYRAQAHEVEWLIGKGHAEIAKA